MKKTKANRQNSVDDVVEALYFLGAIAESEGRSQDAMSSCERALALAPTDAKCVQALKLIQQPTMH